MWFAPFVLVLTLSYALGAPTSKSLQATSGGEITLETGLAGLQGHYNVLWYLAKGSETLVHCDKGEIDVDPPERFKERLYLNQTTGCLTVRDLSIEDSGVFHGEIIDGNNKKHIYSYTVTVSEAATSSPNTAAAQRNHLAAVLALLLSVAVCIELFA